MVYDNYSNIYFVGIGGIGMSALARYFNIIGYNVSGYDKTKTELTQQLEAEGIAVHYDDLGEEVQALIDTPENTLVVVTPAVPSDMGELVYLTKHGFSLKKRAEVLGMITKEYKTLAVAGTHGKTTTSTMLAYVLTSSNLKCNAFLGGISANIDSNLLIDDASELMVVEADEYDRSFLQLSPFSSIITSTEADHLDIYGNAEIMEEAFEEFGQLTHEDGVIVKHYSLSICPNKKAITYGVGEDINADYIGRNIRVEGHEFMMDVVTPSGVHSDIVLGMPGIHNAENALAVIALCESIGLTLDEIKDSLKTFRGVKRRFELHVQNENIIFIDDYAHHPTAIKNLLDSIHLIYTDWPVYLIFQPHLYSRTQDFMTEFAASLSEAENVILLPIYPARELPIEGITSEELAKMVTSNIEVREMNAVVDLVRSIDKGVILTVGAGDISNLVEPIKKALS